ncbi:MAG: dioxygenase [Deltaproteobacteria bacterium]|nr:dioxygenase [Deltaproteobacteria bacterium]
MRSILLHRRSFLTGLLGATGAGLLQACTYNAAAADTVIAPTRAIPLDEAPPPVRACGAATVDQIEGPFYKPRAPHRLAIANDREPGERLVITGTVKSTRCAPLAKAELDIWHADARGDYDNDGYHLRGILATDEQGRFELRSIVPGRYLNGKRYRPSHLHVKLRAHGCEELTTQLYFANDPYLDGDPFMHSSLVMPHRTAGGVRRAAFDFVLQAA